MRLKEEHELKLEHKLKEVDRYARRRLGAPTQDNVLPFAALCTHSAECAAQYQQHSLGVRLGVPLRHAVLGQLQPVKDMLGVVEGRQLGVRVLQYVELLADLRCQ